MATTTLRTAALARRGRDAAWAGEFEFGGRTGVDRDVATRRVGRVASAPDRSRSWKRRGWDRGGVDGYLLAVRASPVARSALFYGGQVIKGSHGHCTQAMIADCTLVLQMSRGEREHARTHARSDVQGVSTQNGDRSPSLGSRAAYKAFR